MADPILAPVGPARRRLVSAAGAARLRWWASVSVAAVIVLAVVFVPLFAELDQRIVHLDDRLLGPSPAHPLGTDELGRDTLLRCVYGMRVSLLVGVVAAVVSTVIGTVVGATAGALGGWTDRVLARLVDVLASVPHLLLGIILVALFRPGPGAVIVSVGLTHWLSTARIVRAEVMSLRTRPFVDAAIAGGASRRRVTMRHFVPNVAPQAALAAVLAVPHAIWHESALSFLGLGMPPHLASLGTMIEDGRQALLTGHWWPAFAPGLFIVVPTLAIAGLAGAWRERIDPRGPGEMRL
ncbi:ABC transporter permease [Embleya sp. NPDC020886]|uniref:ABC transporter permease n=1 Tax=Embleya sp. NPDC020886 TaxID=3363980 RepID=UPI00379C0C4C